jgi:hypothetical protein
MPDSNPERAGTPGPGVLSDLIIGQNYPKGKGEKQLSAFSDQLSAKAPAFHSISPLDRCAQWLKAF